MVVLPMESDQVPSPRNDSTPINEMFGENQGLPTLAEKDQSSLSDIEVVSPATSIDTYQFLPPVDNEDGVVRSMDTKSSLLGRQAELEELRRKKLAKNLRDQKSQQILSMQAVRRQNQERRQSSNGASPSSEISSPGSRFTAASTNISEFEAFYLKQRVQKGEQMKQERDTLELLHHYQNNDVKAKTRVRNESSQQFQHNYSPMISPTPRTGANDERSNSSDDQNEIHGPSPDLPFPPSPGWSRGSLRSNSSKSSGCNSLLILNSEATKDCLNDLGISNSARESTMDTDLVSKADESQVSFGLNGCVDINVVTVDGKEKKHESFINELNKDDLQCSNSQENLQLTVVCNNYEDKTPKHEGISIPTEKGCVDYENNYKHIAPGLLSEDGLGKAHEETETNTDGVEEESNDNKFLIASLISAEDVLKPTNKYTENKLEGLNEGENNKESNVASPQSEEDDLEAPKKGIQISGEKSREEGSKNEFAIAPLRVEDHSDKEEEDTEISIHGFQDQVCIIESLLSEDNDSKGAKEESARSIRADEEIEIESNGETCASNEKLDTKCSVEESYRADEEITQEKGDEVESINGMNVLTLDESNLKEIRCASPVNAEEPDYEQCSTDNTEKNSKKESCIETWKGVSNSSMEENSIEEASSKSESEVHRDTNSLDKICHGHRTKEILSVTPPKNNQGEFVPEYINEVSFAKSDEINEPNILKKEQRLDLLLNHDKIDHDQDCIEHITIEKSDAKLLEVVANVSTEHDEATVEVSSDQADHTISEDHGTRNKIGGLSTAFSSSKRSDKPIRISENDLNKGKVKTTPESFPVSKPKSKYSKKGKTSSTILSEPPTIHQSSSKKLLLHAGSPGLVTHQRKASQQRPQSLISSQNKRNPHRKSAASKNTNLTQTRSPSSLQRKSSPAGKPVSASPMKGSKICQRFPSSSSRLKNASDQIQPTVFKATSKEAESISSSPSKQRSPHKSKPKIPTYLSPGSHANRSESPTRKTRRSKTPSKNIVTPPGIFQSPRQKADDARVTLSPKKNVVPLYQVQPVKVRRFQKRIVSESEKCSRKWQPNLHSSSQGCERCLFFADSKETKDFHLKRHSPRITMTHGGCDRSCSFFPRRPSEHCVRLCPKCFHDTHMLKLW